MSACGGFVDMIAYIFVALEPTILHKWQCILLGSSPDPVLECKGSHDGKRNFLTAQHLCSLCRHRRMTRCT
jgi:hypothetical protein